MFSPCTTLHNTSVWKSAAVENVLVNLTGIVVFLLIITAVISPETTIPRDKGVTSNRIISVISPPIIALWIDAPCDTHSIGSIPLSIDFPVWSSTYFWTIGILVGPPSRIILSISSSVRLASSTAWSILSPHLSTIGRTNDSNFDLLIFSIKFNAFPSSPIAINGRLTSVSGKFVNSIFAFSAPSLNLRRESSPSLKSIPFFFSNSSAR